MKILVQVACEWDPLLTLRVDRQTGVCVTEKGNQLLQVSLEGRLGLESALEQTPQTVAYAIGTGHTEALRFAIAAGALRAVEIPEPSQLVTWIKKESPDLVLADHQAGLLANELGWCHLAGIESFVISDKLVAVRFLGKGNRERVESALPAIIRLGLNRRPKYIARTRIQLVDASRIEAVNFSTCDTPDAPFETRLEPMRPRTKEILNQPTQSKSMDRLSSLMGSVGRGPARPAPTSREKSVPELAEEFIRYLKRFSLLEKRPS